MKSKRAYGNIGSYLFGGDILNREATLELLKKYFKTTYKAPKRYHNIKRETFTVWSYEYFATKELYGYILRSELDILDAIEEFRKKMDDAICIAKNEKTKLIFSCCYDVSTSALDYLISIDEVWNTFRVRKGI